MDEWNNIKKLIKNYGLFFSLNASINNDHEFQNIQKYRIF